MLGLSLSVKHFCVHLLWVLQTPVPMWLSESSTPRTTSVSLQQPRLFTLRSQQLFKVPPACCRPVFSAPLSPATTLMIERDVHVIPWGNSHVPPAHLQPSHVVQMWVFVSEGAFIAFGANLSSFDTRVGPIGNCKSVFFFIIIWECTNKAHPSPPGKV